MLMLVKLILTLQIERQHFGARGCALHCSSVFCPLDLLLVEVFISLFSCDLFTESLAAGFNYELEREERKPINIWPVVNIIFIFTVFNIHRHT